jgi:hypothetical protein
MKTIKLFTGNTGGMPMPKQCRHILTDGDKCHAIALREKPYCYYHMRVHRVMAAARKPSKAKEKTFEFAFPDSQASIQLAIYQIMNALGSSQISPKRAGSLLYSLQIASQNVPHSLETIPKTPVICVSETPEGDEVAPDCRSFEMPRSCGDCENPDANCPMCDETEAHILEIAYGVDGDEKRQRTLPEMLKETIMRQLHGGATPEARQKIHALLSKKETEAKT